MRRPRHPQRSLPLDADDSEALLFQPVNGGNKPTLSETPYFFLPLVDFGSHVKPWTSNPPAQASGSCSVRPTTDHRRTTLLAHTARPATSTTAQAFLTCGFVAPRRRAVLPCHSGIGGDFGDIAHEKASGRNVAGQSSDDGTSAVPLCGPYPNSVRCIRPIDRASCVWQYEVPLVCREEACLRQGCGWSAALNQRA